MAGDGRDPQVCRRAGIAHCGLILVTVPDDDVANQMVTVLRSQNPSAAIVLRCRYQANIDRVKKSGATAVVSEEAEASGALLRWCERLVSRP